MVVRWEALLVRPELRGGSLGEVDTDHVRQAQQVQQDIGHLFRQPTLQGLRAKGMSILMVEQNAKRALEISDFGVVSLRVGAQRGQKASQGRR